MDRITTFTAPTEILSSFLNSLQDLAAPVAALDGQLSGGYLSSSGTTISVSPVHKLVLGGVVASTTVATVLTPGSGGVPTLSTDTWYVVWAKITSGAVAFEVEEYAGNEPDLALVYKSGDTTLRYLGSFVTYSDSGTKILPFRQLPGGVVSYNQRLDTHVLLDTLTDATAAPHDADHSLDLSVRLPPHTASAVVRCKLNDSGSQYRFYFRNPGLTGYEGREFDIYPGGPTQTFYVGTVEGNGLQVLEVRTSTVTNTLTSLEVYCDGYVEMVSK